MPATNWFRSQQTVGSSCSSQERTGTEVRGSHRHFSGEILQTLDIVLCIQPGEFWTIVAPRRQAKSGEENRTVGVGISEVWSVQAVPPPVNLHANACDSQKSDQRIGRCYRQSPQAIDLKIGHSKAHPRRSKMGKAQQQRRRGEAVLTAKVTSVEFVTAVILK